MAQPRGPHFRDVHKRIALHAASQAAIKALPTYNESRQDGAITALDDYSLWIFDADSTAAAAATVLVPDSGTGRWHCLIPAGGLAGTSYKAPVRLATAGALPAYARVGNVITGAAPGALGNVDGVAVVAGDRLLLTSDGTASDVDNGIWVATSIGGATAYVLTRADDANATGEIVGGMLVPVQAGSSYTGEVFIVTNSAAIVVNTTAITLAQLPSYTDLASTSAGQGASMIGVQDAAGRFAGANAETVLADLGARVALAFADTTAQEAYPAAARADRMIAIVDDDDAGAHADGSLWYFDAASAAGASDYVRVPDAGTGRWLRLIPTIAELAAVTTGLGASMVGAEDAAGRYAGANVEAIAADLGARLALAFANTTEQTAYSATARADRQLAVVDDDDAGAHADGSIWIFDAGSAAGASDYVRVPDAGTGRWLRVLPTLAELASAAAGLGGSLVGVEDAAGRFAGTETETVLADLGARLALAFDNTTAQTAFGATARADRQLAIVDDDDAGAHADGSLWIFDAASAAGASDYVRVPDAGTGRWLRLLPTLAELAAVTTGLGASLIGVEDAAGVLAATTVEAAVVENAANLDVHRPGVPMINRLVMLGAPGAIAAGDTVTIGADVFEFNAATPPAGGTAGRIWVYQGADSAASRANFINAVNGVIDAPNITYDGPVTESMVAAAGTLLGTVDVLSADSTGGAAAPSGTATACTETLTTPTDIWDSPTMYAGQAQGSTQLQLTTVTITAAMIAQGTLEIEYDFTPVSCMLLSRSGTTAEAYTITGDRVVLTLSGGGPPAYQVGSVLDVLAQG